MFYIGNQWIGPEDTTTFLEDSDGEARGRIRAVDNIIRPFVNQMINEASKMSLNFKARSEGDRVINRREKELAKMKAGRVLADRYPALTSTIKKSMPIGKDMEETEEIFRNVWTDKYEKTVNNLTKFISDKNKLNTILLNMAAENLAVSGMSVFKNECIGGEMVIRVIDSENFFFDSGCQYYDLTDAEYMGHTDYCMPTDLYERYNLSQETKIKIEKYTRELPVAAPTIMPVPYSYSYLPGRIPVIYVEWRDSDKYNYGYVIDNFGYEMFTRVYPNNYKPKSNERVYFEKDLIEPRSEVRKRIMEGKIKKTIDVETLRYCRFTPSEIYTGGEGHDIVYEYGVCPYQETYALDPTTVEFSYRAVCWGYHDGYISSPIDDIIDPQRLMNRANSIAESRMNRDTSGVLIDAWATMGTNMSEEELQRKAERGDTIIVNSKGMGIPNAAGEYGAKLAQSAQMLYTIANEQAAKIQARIGVLNVPGKESKKALMGAEAEEQSLHGLYLDRLVHLMQQEYQCISNKGRRIYAESPRRLSIMVGDKGAEEIRITKDMLLEDFRMFIQRADDEKQSKNAANLALTQLLQMNIITKNDFSDNYGRVTLEEVGKVIRDSAVRTQAAQKAQAEEQQQQQQQQNMLMQANMERQELEKKRLEGIELSEAEKDRMSKLDAIILRAKMKMEADKNKHQLNMEQMRHEQKD